MYTSFVALPYISTSLILSIHYVTSWDNSDIQWWWWLWWWLMMIIVTRSVGLIPRINEIDWWRLTTKSSNIFSLFSFQLVLFCVIVWQLHIVSIKIDYIVLQSFYDFRILKQSAHCWSCALVWKIKCLIPSCQSLKSSHSWSHAPR